MDARDIKKAYCINLDARIERWDTFCESLPDPWPLVDVERVRAIDGKLCPFPPWWRQGRGAWGCFRTHLMVLEQSLNLGDESYLVFEDDAIFRDGFSERLEAFLSEVPDDWGMIYLGGQHLKCAESPPVRVSPNVFRCNNVNRTHAFAVHRRAMGELYKHLTRHNWHYKDHVDHRIGRIVESRAFPVYAPSRWLVGQRAGRSDICERDTPEIYWPDSESYEGMHDSPFVVVLGLHSSGSSCVAGVLYHLGLHLGNKLGGYYGNDPEKSCGFEAVWLAKICEECIPFPSTSPKVDRSVIRSRLNAWIGEKKIEARRKGVIPGCKYPQLCQMGDELISVCGPGLRVVVCDRCIEDSIESLAKRTGLKRDVIVAHQRWLDDGKRSILSKLKPDQYVRIDYDWMLQRPEHAVRKIASFLGISPTCNRLSKAIAWIQPKKRHVCSQVN